MRLQMVIRADMATIDPYDLVSSERSRDALDLYLNMARAAVQMAYPGLDVITDIGLGPCDFPQTCNGAADANLRHEIGGLLDDTRRLWEASLPMRWYGLD